MQRTIVVDRKRNSKRVYTVLALFYMSVSLFAAHNVTFWWKMRSNRFYVIKVADSYSSAPIGRLFSLFSCLSLAIFSFFTLS